MMPASDRYVEDLYNLVNKQDGENTRLEVARIALLAAQHRANAIKQQRTQRAIERVKAERKELIGVSRDQQQRAADESFRRDGA